MRVKSSDGKTLVAIITTEHPASSYGVPVIVIQGEPLGVLDWVHGGYEILEASPEEEELFYQFMTKALGYENVISGRQG